MSQLQSHLSPNAARYVLLKVAPGEPDGFVAVTYVPNSAPVREKMLFASTRLTLVRELGIERFRETLFATEASELTAEGWARHEKHSKQDAPLTEEEAGQAGLREAEAQESGGTTARKGHVGSKVDAINTEDGLPEALAELMKEGSGGLLVQLVSVKEKRRFQQDQGHANSLMFSTSTFPTKPFASPRPRPQYLLHS